MLVLNHSQSLQVFPKSWGDKHPWTQHGQGLRHVGRWWWSSSLGSTRSMGDAWDAHAVDPSALSWSLPWISKHQTIIKRCHHHYLSRYQSSWSLVIINHYQSLSISVIINISHHQLEHHQQSPVSIDPSQLEHHRAIIKHHRTIRKQPEVTNHEQPSFKLFVIIHSTIDMISCNH